MHFLEALEALDAFCACEQIERHIERQDSVRDRRGYPLDLVVREVDYLCSLKDAQRSLDLRYCESTALSEGVGGMTARVEVRDSS